MNTENELIKKLRIINKRNPALWNSVVAYINGANAALECGVRQVAPSQAVESVALPESAVESVAESLPEASPVESQEPAYRFILNVPEIKDYKEVK